MRRSGQSVATQETRGIAAVHFSLLRSLALLLVCGMVAACGQKGPLTLPQSAGSAASAPAR